MNLSSSSARARTSAALVIILLLLAQVGVLLAASPARAADRPSDDTVLLRILRDTNRTRIEHGLAPLYRNPAVDAVAAGWSGRQAAASAMSHNPDFSRQIPAGWSRAGENVAYGYDPAGVSNTYIAVVDAWRNSPGHMANLVGDYTDIGLGIAYSSKGWAFYTQNFGKYSGAASAASLGPGAAVLLDNQWVDSRTGLPTAAPAPPGAGDLVKTASDPTVYLLDGAARRIRLTTFDISGALGLGGVKTVTPAQLAGYALAADPLSPLVSCGGVRYIGSGGRAVRVDPATAFPVTALADATCARFARVAGPLTDHFTLRTPDGSIWTVRDGVMRRAASWAALVAATGTGSPSWIPVPFGSLAALPAGPDLLAPGSLVKSAGDPTVYWVDGDAAKIRVPSFTVARAFGVSAVSVANAAALAAYPTGPSDLAPVVSCPSGWFLAGGSGLTAISRDLAGAFPDRVSVSASGCSALRVLNSSPSDRAWVLQPSGDVWSVTAGSVQRASSWSALVAANGGTVPSWSVLPGGILAGFDRGPDVVATGELIRTDADPQVWLVDEGRRIPVSSLDIAAQFRFTGVARVTPATVDSLEQASTRLGVVVRSADGGVWAAGSGALDRATDEAVGDLAVATLSDRLIAGVPHRRDQAQDDLLLRSSNGTVFAVANGVRRPFASWSALVAFSGTSSPSWVQTSDAGIAAIPLGRAIA